MRPEATPPSPTLGPPAALQRVAQEFELDAAQAQTAAQWAQAMLQGEGAWVWDNTVLAWQANEVPITQRGRALRMDRLVQQQGGAWWVLDYKSSAQPSGTPCAPSCAATARRWPWLTPDGRCAQPF